MYRLQESSPQTWTLHICCHDAIETCCLQYEASEASALNMLAGRLDWQFTHKQSTNSSVAHPPATFLSSLTQGMTLVDVRHDKSIGAWEVCASCPAPSVTLPKTIGKKRKVNVMTEGVVLEEGEEAENPSHVQPVDSLCSAAAPVVSAPHPVEEGHESHWVRLRRMYEQCMASGGFEEMVCSVEVLRMAGYSVNECPAAGASDAPSVGTGVSNCAFDADITSVPVVRNSATCASSCVGGTSIQLPVEVEEGEEVEGEGVEEGGMEELRQEVFPSRKAEEQEEGLHDNRYPSGALGICSIDCEMCETAAGNTLTRLSVVCPVRGLVIDMLVRLVGLVWKIISPRPRRCGCNRCCQTCPSLTTTPSSPASRNR